MSRAKKYIDSLVADGVTVIVSPLAFRLVGPGEVVYPAMDLFDNDYALSVAVFEYFGLL